MTKRSSFRIAALCATLAFAACAGVTSNLAFRPPAGWSGTPSMFGRMQMWVKPRGSKNAEQMVLLVRAGLSTGDLFQNVQSGRGKVSELKRSTITICDGRQAQYATALGEPDKNGRRARIEAVTADVGDAKYMAMYARDAGTPADPGAETAIRSLCPKG